MRLKAYSKFTSNTFKRNFLTYRMSVLLWFISDFIGFLLVYFLWKSIFSSSPTPVINGYTFGSMMVYYAISSSISLFATTDILGIVREDIKKGTISMQLIKPMSYTKYLFFYQFGGTIGMFLFFSIPFFIIAIIFAIIHGVMINITILGIISFIISLILAFFISFFIEILFSTILFKTTNAFGVYQLKAATILILSGALIPIDFYPDMIQNILKYLPFQYMNFIPSSIFLGNIAGIDIIKNLLIQLSWVLILMFLSTYLWNKSIKKAVILGG